MDQAAIETAKLLATGSVQIVLAVGLVFFALVAVYLGRVLYNEIKACNAVMLDLTNRKIESDNKMTTALEAIRSVVETVMRSKP